MKLYRTAFLVLCYARLTFGEPQTLGRPEASGSSQQENERLEEETTFRSQGGADEVSTRLRDTDTSGRALQEEVVEVEEEDSTFGFFRPIAVYKVVFDLFGISYGRSARQASPIVDDICNCTAVDEVVCSCVNATDAPGTHAPTTPPSTTPTSTAPPSAAPTETFYCGCRDCNTEVWNRSTFGHSCGDRILYLQTEDGGGLDESSACQVIANQYPEICGPFCDPLVCDDRPVSFCGCPSCNAEIWYTMAGTLTCGQRILNLQTEAGGNLTELEACNIVSDDFPFDCGPPCHSDRCQEEARYCGCEDCTPEVWESAAGSFSCGERVRDIFYQENLSPDAACTSTAEDYPWECGESCHPEKCDGQSPPLCGCAECTMEIWDSPAGSNFTCGERITGLWKDEGFTEQEACTAVARQFPFACGAYCHPDKCDDQAPAVCGCQACTAEIWDRAAGNFSCGERILDWQVSSGYSELEACARVAKEYPLTCGPDCNPDKCDNQAPAVCGCQSCTSEIWDRSAGAFTCGGRILDLQLSTGFAEEEACATVSQIYPFTCGPECNPEKCDDQAPAVCGCAECTEDVWLEEAGDFPCGDRILFLQTDEGGDLDESEACENVSYDFPFTCGPSCHPDRCFNSTPAVCGCSSCSEEIWNRDAEGFSCGARIRFLESPAGGRLSELEACASVSSTYIDICGPDCNPDICDGQGPAFCGCDDCTFEVWNTMALGFTCGDRILSFRPTDISSDEACAMVSDEFTGLCGPQCHPGKCDGQCLAEPFELQDGTINTERLAPNATIYCYPPYEDRLRFSNAWGFFTVEAKESADNICGPAGNLFGKEVVSFDPIAEELTLEYAFVNGKWTASEVRLTQEDIFNYGEYSFHVKSVAVIEDGVQVSDRLPADLVLGLFSFDASDANVESSFNHEVDIELSQFGDPEAPDVQFLVQPDNIPGPHFPIDRRFFSGGSTDTFEQAGHFYNFTWNPTSIHWSTTSGGGQEYTYTTEVARLACTQDYIQCLPNNVDIRLNLWEISGGVVRTPAFVNVTNETNTRVAVVIDYVGYVPSGISHAPDEAECSKHCQCSSLSLCLNGTCTASG